MENRSPLRSARWKSMSPENISATCTAIASGMRASSVAANSELWILPLASRVETVSAAVSSLEAQAPPTGSITRRLNWPSSSALQRALSFCKVFCLLASALTKRPLRPSSKRAFGSERKNRAADGSSTPKRRSRLSAVSEARVRSERYRFSAGASRLAEPTSSGRAIDSTT